MANISVPDNPQLNLQMEAMETTTPAHCDQWNGKHQQLLNNDKYLSKKIEETATSAGKKMDKTAVVDELDAVLAVTEDKVPVGSKAIQELNSNLNESLSALGGFEIDTATGKITGYKTAIGGADTVFPFSGDAEFAYFVMSLYEKNNSGFILCKGNYISLKNNASTIITENYVGNRIKYAPINNQKAAFYAVTDGKYARKDQTHPYEIIDAKAGDLLATALNSGYEMFVLSM